MEKRKIELISCAYRLTFNDHYYTVRYEYGTGISLPGWYVDGVYVCPFNLSLGTKMYEMAVNVLRVWLKLEASEDIEVTIPNA